VYQLSVTPSYNLTSTEHISFEKLEGKQKKFQKKSADIKGPQRKQSAKQTQKKGEDTDGETEQETEMSGLLRGGGQ